MVSRKMRPAAALSLIRRRARERDLTIRELPERPRASHRMYVVEESSGARVGNFGLTGHPKELSWTVLERLAERLAPLFGEGWMGS